MPFWQAEVVQDRHYLIRPQINVMGEEGDGKDDDDDDALFGAEEESEEKGDSESLRCSTCDPGGGERKNDDEAR